MTWELMPLSLSNEMTEYLQSGPIRKQGLFKLSAILLFSLLYTSPLYISLAETPLSEVMVHIGWRGGDHYEPLFSLLYISPLYISLAETPLSEVMVHVRLEGRRSLCKSQFSNLRPDSWYAGGGDIWQPQTSFTTFNKFSNNRKYFSCLINKSGQIVLNW